MRKRSLFYSVMCIIMLCCACVDNEKIDKKKVNEMNNGAVSESVSETETKLTENIDYEYADLIDDDIVWFSLPVVSEGEEPLASSVSYGKIVKYEKIEKFLQRQDDGSDLLYAVRLVQMSDYDMRYVYDEFVKNMEVRTEFDGKTDEEVYEILEQRKISGDENLFHIYGTKEELLELTECPNDMKFIMVMSSKLDYIEITEEGLEMYPYYNIPISWHGQSQYKTRDEIRELWDVGETVYWNWTLMNEQWKQDYNK